MTPEQEIFFLKETIATYINYGRFKQESDALGALNRKGIGFWVDRCFSDHNIRADEIHVRPIYCNSEMLNIKMDIVQSLYKKWKTERINGPSNETYAELVAAVKDYNAEKLNQ